MAIAPPSIGASQVVSAIDRKARMASSWHERPLWLVVWLTALYSFPKRILDTLESEYVPPFGVLPFSTIIIGDGWEILIYSPIGND